MQSSIQTRRPFSLALGVTAALGLAVGMLALATAPAGAATASATCPVVNPQSGAVTPAGPWDGLNWSGCDLSGADFGHGTLINDYMPGANLTGASLTDAYLLDDNMGAANLSGAALTGVDSVGVTGTPSLPADWSIYNGHLIGPGAILTCAGLSGDNLSGADLSGTNLNCANLSNVNFSDANLTGSDLDTATLAGANFSGADMSGVNLANASSGGVIGRPVNIPPDWALTQGYFIGPDAYLVGADLDGADLAGDVMTGAFLTEANLTGANLSGDNLAKAFFDDVTLTGADLNGTDLTNSYLTDGGAFWSVTSGGITGVPLLPATWSLVHGYLIGPGANLSGANLAGAELANKDLNSTELLRADLSGADLSDANLSGASFVYTDLRNANMSGAQTNAASWIDTTCPDGTNSSQHVAGCFTAFDTMPPSATPAVTSGRLGTYGWYTSPVTVHWEWADNGQINQSKCQATSTTTGSGDPVTLTAACTDLAGNTGHASFAVKVDTTAPAVSVTGVVAGHQYVLGHVPAVGCRTIEKISGVARPAAVTITRGMNNVGRFTATCSGAVSMAGIAQHVPVNASYTVVYGFGGFIGPTAGAVIARTAHTVTAKFRFTDGVGHAIAANIAATLAARHDVQAVLSGPGIKSVTAACRWVASDSAFECVIKIPGGVRTGKTRYLISAMENVGTGFTMAPAVGGVNPEPISFR